MKIIDQNDPAALAEAARILRSGGLLVYPTETFYGLGADARSAAAVARLCELKRRRTDAPLPVIVPRGGEGQVASSIGEAAARLFSRYWPGPLTLVLPAHHGLPPQLYGPGQKIGLRTPSGAFALLLVEEFGGPIVSTSANVSGRPAPAALAELDEEIAAGVELVVDGGELPGRRGSTVVDASGERPVILRAGDLDLEDL